MSKIEVNTIEPQTGTDVTIGASGDNTVITGDLTVNTSTLKVDSTNGKVGIGDTSPDAMLSIKGNTDNGATPTIRLKDQTDAREAFISNQSGDLILATSNSSDDTIDSALTIYTSSMIFKTDGTNRITLDNVGNFKATRGGAALNANSTHQLIDAGANSYSLMLSNKSSSPASQYMLEIGFKSASPDNNSARFVQCLDSTTTRAEIMSDGDFRSHDNSYGSTSDERIKQDIVDAGSQWEDIKAFRIRKYKKKDDVRQYGADEAKVHIGVIAQELETVSPGLIKEQEPGIGDIKSSSEFGELYQEGDTIPEGKAVGDIKTISANVKSVNYSVLYMKAIKALQEAITKIETLETENTSIKARLDVLEDS